MEPVSTGAILGSSAIGAGGAIIGSLLGGGVNKHESRNNRREARRQFNNAVQVRVADALKAGINPLAALGYNGSSPTVHAGGTSGAGDIYAEGISKAAAAVGNGIERLAMNKAAMDKAADDMNYDSTSKELDLEGQRLQNDISRLQIQTLQRNLNPAPEVPEVPLALDGAPLVFRPAYDMEGRPRLVINQDVLEGDSDNPGYLATIGNLYLSGHIDHTTGKLDKDAADKVRWLYKNSTGKDLWNYEEAYISPSEAAAAAAMFARGVS